jgi:hypothetical protein
MINKEGPIFTSGKRKNLMRKSLTISFVLLILIAGYAVTALAVGPVFWRVNTRAEIEKGDASGVSIAENGTLTLAPSVTEVFDTKQAYIWSSAVDNAGNVYLGTGHEGRIFKVDASGRGSLLYKSSELDVTALAVDSRGVLYAGTSPDGKVYRITSDGTASAFFEPKSKYIWSLAFDRQGRLVVGTGDKGGVYRVTPDGKGSLLTTTTQTNITSVLIDAAGNIIAGTDPGGLVLRIWPEGRVFTLFDSAQREVHELALGAGGEIYALTVTESASGAGANAAAPVATPATPAASDESVTITIGDVQVIDSTAMAGAGASGTTSSAAVKSVVYRIDQNGGADALWESRDSAGFALTVARDGQVLVGTGLKGRIYCLESGRKPLLLSQSGEAQTARFVTAGDRLYAATSNLGKLYRIGKDLGASGTYTSTVKDALTTAAWGVVQWAGDGNIEIQTRTGNTAVPDSTWSDWSAALKRADGEAISSPRARFIQWRATLKTGSQPPRLREVLVSYLPKNVAPRVTTITILPVGIGLQALPQQPVDPGAEQAGIEPMTLGVVTVMPPRRIFQRGAVSLQWQSEDRNGDSVEYAIYYRAASGGEFYPVKTGLRENYYTIEPNALPDGRYVFRIVVTDSPSNPPGVSLSDDLETEPIDIDNTPPAVTVGQPARSGEMTVVEFQVSDTTSILRRAEYQLDGGTWQSVYPVDGITDSRREVFQVRVKVTDDRPHLLAFRVFDANANVGNGQAPLRGSAR